MSPPKPSRRRGPIGFIAGLLLAGAALLCWPASLGGCSTLTVVAGASMEPTHHAGDLAVAWCLIEPQVGDVIVYRPDDVRGSVIHRVSTRDANGMMTAIGDANATPDPWRIDEDWVLGTEVLHVPHLGLLLRSPGVWASLLIAAAGLLLVPSGGRPAPAP